METEQHTASGGRIGHSPATRPRRHPAARGSRGRRGYPTPPRRTEARAERDRLRDVALGPSFGPHPGVLSDPYLPATEIPMPRETSRNTVGKAKLMAASASVPYWPGQNVSARLYAVRKRFVTTIDRKNSGVLMPPDSGRTRRVLKRHAHRSLTARVVVSPKHSTVPRSARRARRARVGGCSCPIRSPRAGVARNSPERDARSSRAALGQYFVSAPETPSRSFSSASSASRSSRQRKNSSRSSG